MLEITNLRDGAVLDHRNGIETDDCLEIEVTGLASSQAVVTVNGKKAQKCDRFFTAKVILTRQINEIIATASDAFGEYSQKITVAWDKKSFKRYNFFIDDCCFFLRDITKKRPVSIFDEMFLHRLQSIHHEFGTKFTLNLFYRDDHHKDFCLADMPDTYKTEFKQNSDWLRMSFHAKSEFPDRPYQGASDAALAADFDLIKAEVTRFAGEQSFIVPLVIHWGMTNPGNFHVLQDRGVKLLTGGFLGCATYIGESHSDEVCDIGYFYERDITIYLMKASRFYDRRKKLFLMSNLCCCNLTEQPGLLNAFKELEQNPRDTLSLMTHEQYSFPDYFNYLPDHLDRIELVCRLAAEAGYKPVWFAENMAGNSAWYV